MKFPWRGIGIFSVGAAFGSLVVGRRCLQALRHLVDTEDDHIVDTVKAYREWDLIRSVPEEERPPELKLQ